jgi:hypothetical protein
MQHDLEKALNVKLILCMFEQLSGLKINFHKSEIFCFGKKRPGINTDFFLVVRSVLFLLNTLVYLFISQVEEW